MRNTIVSYIYPLNRNRPFPSSKDSHFQGEAKCKTFLVKKYPDSIISLFVYLFYLFCFVLFSAEADSGFSWRFLSASSMLRELSW